MAIVELCSPKTTPPSVGETGLALVIRPVFVSETENTKYAVDYRDSEKGIKTHKVFKIERLFN